MLTVVMSVVVMSEPFHNELIVTSSYSKVLIVFRFVTKGHEEEEKETMD